MRPEISRAIPVLRENPRVACPDATTHERLMNMMLDLLAHRNRPRRRLHPERRLDNIDPFEPHERPQQQRIIGQRKRPARATGVNNRAAPHCPPDRQKIGQKIRGNRSPAAIDPQPRDLVVAQPGDPLDRPGRRADRLHRAGNPEIADTAQMRRQILFPQVIGVKTVRPPKQRDTAQHCIALFNHD